MPDTNTATDTNKNRLLPKAGEIKMRLYGQGLGDCFLLAFPRKGDSENKNPCYLVIDCGAAFSTPDRGKRAKRVVKDIREATGGHIDALAITHQHFDHLSGFLDAWQEWNQITVDTLYLPWTEVNAEDGEFKSASALLKVLNKAADDVLKMTEKMGVTEAYPGLAAEADFLGVARGPKSRDNSEEFSNDMAGAMDFVRSMADGKVRYFVPGDVFRLPGTEFHGYVLGPPLPTNKREDGKAYVELLVDEKEMYSYGPPLNMKVDEGKPGGTRAFALSDDHGLPALASALFAMDGIRDTHSRDADEGFCPFAPEIRLPWDYAMASPFFQEYYSDTTKDGSTDAWRRVDRDWLGSAASLALQAGGFTNNVSLVLAFSIPGSEKMLLFPGDAQVGNWLSWHTIKSWNKGDDPLPDEAPAPDDNNPLMDNLLSRVAFYKVGHHGSHNATVSEQGLEKMTHPGLVAYIPVSVPVAQDKMTYCPMPFYPVVRALQKRTQGRVFLANGQAVHPLPEGKTNANLLDESGIVPASENLDMTVTVTDAKTGKETPLTETIPLYLEATVVG